MWILDLEDSRRITRQTILEKWSMKKFEEESLKHAWPVNLSPGQSHLFFQEHIHGNVNNNEGYTRASIDVRILLKGEEYGRRSPGGFFRIPGDYYTSQPIDLSDKKFISFVSWASEYGKNLSYPMQRSTISRYCDMYKIKLSYEDGEFDNNDWHMMLEWYLQTSEADGIVLPSIHSLPDDSERRNELLKLALHQKIELHFADEFLVLRNDNDMEKINTYLTFAVRKKDSYIWEE